MQHGRQTQQTKQAQQTQQTKQAQQTKQTPQNQPPWQTWAGLILVTAIAMLSFSHAIEAPRRTAYTIARAYEQRKAERQLPAAMVTEAGITLHYKDDDKDLTDPILAELKAMREPVAELLGLPPPERVTAVLHPSRAHLAAVFGWNDSQRAHGVYAAGIVRLLTPRAWLPNVEPSDTETLKTALRAYGPVAHELAHLILDLHTGGNYPAWLSEGLAQWVEFQLGSVQGPEDEGMWHDIEAPYTFADLADFDALPNEAQAYRQSYQAVAWLAEQHGPDGIRQLVASLAHGLKFEAALEQTFGLTLPQLQESLLAGEKPTRGGTKCESS